MKVFVTGACGQLGHDVICELLNREHEVIGSDILGTDDYVQLDITDADSVKKVILGYHPDAVIHCAAFTAVDLAEEEVNRDKVRKINVEGTRNIALACREYGSKMLYLSTDYVFDGSGEEPWKVGDGCSPLNYYGSTKLEGELCVSSLLDKFFIVRTSWVFGLYGKNFVKTMLEVGKKYESVRVVDDQIGTPTYTVDLARLLCDMIESDRYGYYHASNEGGYISWYEFTKEIYRIAGLNTAVKGVSTEEYGLNKAKRPFNSRLDKSKLCENGFAALPDWKDALVRFMDVYLRK